MMFAEIRAAIEDGLARLGAGEATFEITRAGDVLHGDLAVNAAFGAAHLLGEPPRKIATALCEHLVRDDRVETAAVGGAGFVNLGLSKGFLEAAARALQAEPRGDALPLQGMRVHTVTDRAEGHREVWTARATAEIASALGAEAAFIRPSDARFALGDLLGADAPFKDVTEPERDALEVEVGRAAAAFEKTDALRLFAARGGGFRPGLVEAALGDGAVAVAQAALTLPADLSAEDFEFARQYVLTHRGDKPLAPQTAALRAPEQSNPVFALHYAHASFERTLRQDVGGLAGQAERRLLCGLASYPEVLRLAHRLGEPQRLGLFLARMAREWISLRRNVGSRGEKAIDGALMHAASVVFSDAFAILQIKPQGEIT